VVSVGLVVWSRTVATIAAIAAGASGVGFAGLLGAVAGVGDGGAVGFGDVPSGVGVVAVDA